MSVGAGEGGIHCGRQARPVQTGKALGAWEGLFLRVKLPRIIKSVPHRVVEKSEGIIMEVRTCRIYSRS